MYSDGSDFFEQLRYASRFRRLSQVPQLPTFQHHDLGSTQTNPINLQRLSDRYKPDFVP